MEILKPEDIRAEFDAAFRQLSRSMDFLMPDPMVDPYIEDFKLLGTIREGAGNLYRDERLNLKDCSKKQRESFAKSLGLADAGEFAFYGLLYPFREAMFAHSNEKQVAFTKEIFIKLVF